MHPGVTVENSKGQKDELIVQGKGTFRYYVNAHRVGLFLGFRISQECVDCRIKICRGYTVISKRGLFQNRIFDDMEIICKTLSSCF